MEIKANLKIQLLANDVVVAESDDPVLWNRVLQTAQKAPETPKLLTHDRSLSANATHGAYEAPIIVEPVSDIDSMNSPLQKLARTIGISPEEIEGACYPSSEEPYLRIDSHHWAAFMKNTPQRGTGAISAAAAISTLLLQWFKYAGLGDVDRAMAFRILRDLGVTTNNFNRGIKACAWLNLHGTTLRLNPSAIPQADALVRAFCTKQAVQE